MPLPEYHRVQLDELTVSLEEQRKKAKEEEIPLLTLWEYKPTRGAVVAACGAGWIGGFLFGVTMFGLLQLLPS